MTAFYFMPCIGIFLHAAGSVRRRHHFSSVISQIYGVGAGLEEKVG